MLTFAGKEIPGSHGPIIYASPELAVTELQFWESDGIAEIVGGQGGRWLTVRHTLHNRCQQPKDLTKELNKLKSYQGTVGDLKETGTIEQTFKNCSFRGWEPDILPGQRDPGPLKDVAGTLLDDEGNADGGWFITILLQFRQLYSQVTAGASGGDE